MSLFGIMVTQRKNIYVNSTFADRINESVLVVNSTAPFTIGSLQKFRFANARKWMLLNIFKQGSDTFQNSCVRFAFPIIQVFFGLGKQNYFHISSSVTTLPLPSLISSSPLRRISTISGDDIIYSVSSMVLRLAVILLRAFKAFFISPSSSAMMLNSRNNSAFNSNAVMIYTS